MPDLVRLSDLNSVIGHESPYPAMRDDICDTESVSVIHGIHTDTQTCTHAHAHMLTHTLSNTHTHKKNAANIYVDMHNIPTHIQASPFENIGELNIVLLKMPRRAIGELKIALLKWPRRAIDIIAELSPYKTTVT